MQHFLKITKNLNGIDSHKRMVLLRFTTELYMYKKTSFGRWLLVNKQTIVKFTLILSEGF